MGVGSLTFFLVYESRTKDALLWTTGREAEIYCALEKFRAVAFITGSFVLFKLHKRLLLLFFL